MVFKQYIQKSIPKIVEEMVIDYILSQSHELASAFSLSKPDSALHCLQGTLLGYMNTELKRLNPFPVENLTV